MTKTKKIEIFDENGQYHCNDGPALIDEVGTKFWYKHGLQHRDGGPATETIKGNKYWFKNNKLHRNDGPAVELNGERQWFLNGKFVTNKCQEEFERLLILKPFW